MPPLSARAKLANLSRRRSLSQEINRLKKHYSGTFTRRFGRTASESQMQAIQNLVRELAARRIQGAVRRHQQRRRNISRARAPATLVRQAAMSPAYVTRLYSMYGPEGLKHF